MPDVVTYSASPDGSGQLPSTSKFEHVDSCINYNAVKFKGIGDEDGRDVDMVVRDK